MLVATLLYQLHPVFKKHSLKAKMLCSALFVVTGIFAALAYGEKTDYSVLICTPKVRHFWRCIFLCQRKDKSKKDIVQNSKQVL